MPNKSVEAAQDPRLNRLALALLIVVLVPFSALAVIGVSNARADQQWQPVTATIEDVSMVASEKRNNYAVLRVRYRYSVGHASYVSDRFSREQPDQSAQTPVVAEWARDMRSKASLTVYYDPQAPSESIRERRPMSEAYVPAGFAGTALVLLAWVLGSWARSSRDRRSKGSIRPPPPAGTS